MPLKEFVNTKTSYKNEWSTKMVGINGRLPYQSLGVSKLNAGQDGAKIEEKQPEVKPETTEIATGKQGAPGTGGVMPSTDLLIASHGIKIEKPKVNQEEVEISNTIIKGRSEGECIDMFNLRKDSLKEGDIIYYYDHQLRDYVVFTVHIVNGRVDCKKSFTSVKPQ